MNRKSVVVAFNPVSQSPAFDAEALIHLDNLENKTIGFLSNNKPNADVLLKKISGMLRERFGIREHHYKKRGPTIQAPDDVIREIDSECDAAVVAIGD